MKPVVVLLSAASIVPRARVLDDRILVHQTVHLPRNVLDDVLTLFVCRLSERKASVGVEGSGLEGGDQIREAFHQGHLPKSKRDKETLRSVGRPAGAVSPCGFNRGVCLPWARGRRGLWVGCVERYDKGRELQWTLRRRDPETDQQR